MPPCLRCYRSDRTLEVRRAMRREDGAAGRASRARHVEYTRAPTARFHQFLDVSERPRASPSAQFGAVEARGRVRMGRLEG